ncbi:hypothetical protein HK098_005221 [Nowakowskiella sp. JEL0407]|nr:hypothetical protein HK098_005221 [Nowakowskiella sp. JEL0407]
MSAPIDNKPYFKTIINRNFHRGAPLRNASILLLSLILVNVGIWVSAVIAASNWLATLLPLFVVAFTLGLRHAFDADHIAAIDNVTRKLVGDGQKPVSVGFWFALGHSTVVIVGTIIASIAMSSISEHLEEYQKKSGIVGSSISAAFLLIIGFINCVAVYQIVKALRLIRSSGVLNPNQGNTEPYGCLTKVFFLPLFKFINASWKMYPLGFLFGLGFDTASEIILLAFSALQIQNDIPKWLIGFLPALFTGGMVLLDTLDGLFMLGAYGWASINPVRKLYYNLTITLISVVVAILIGLFQLVTAIYKSLDDESLDQYPFWNFISMISEKFEFVGMFIFASFFLAWIISTAIYFGLGYHKLEIKVEETLLDSETKNEVEGAEGELPTREN